MGQKRTASDNFGTDRVAKPTQPMGDGTAQSPPLATLVHEATGRIYPLLADVVTIGRDKSCAILIGEDTRASRKHAQILRRGPIFQLEDLNSSNGVFVNGARIAGPHELRVGDRVEIGTQVYVFRRRA